MILANQNEVTTNLTGSKEFSVSDDSAKIFSFLSDFLYKNKERSVMTELCSNALDAHIMVGKSDLPIEVFLPTELQKEFRVRDFGPGLSEEQVYQFLTKYGSSSKTQDANAIGGFGIGSKSPAAVTKTWTINSFHNGEKSSYLIHVNDRGIPSINKTMSVPTEETGLEVVVPTRNTHEWMNAAKSTFEYYEVMPKFNSNHTVAQKVFDFSFNGLYKMANTTTNQWYHDGNGLYVIMNRRAYRLEFDKIDLLGMQFTRSVYMDFDISSLSVSLSREDLQYDSNTINGVNARLKEIKRALSQKWAKEVSVAAGVFDYQLAIRKFMDETHVGTSVCVDFATAMNDPLRQSVDFNNLNSFTFVMTESDNYTLNVVSEERNRRIKRGARLYGKNNIGVRRNRDNMHVLTFTASDYEDIIFVCNDDKWAISRIRGAMDEGVIGTRDVVLLTQTWFDLVPNEFIKFKTTDFPRPTIVRTPRAAREKVESKLWVRDGGRLVRREESDFDQNVTAVCIKFDNANTIKSIDSAQEKFIEYFSGHVNLVFVKDMADMPSWSVTPEVWAEKKHASIVGRADELVMRHKKRVLRGIQYQSRGVSGIVSRLIDNKGYLNYTGTSSVFGSIVGEIREIMESKVDITDNGEYALLTELNEYLGKSTKIKLEFDSHTNIYSKLISAYPMLGLVTEYINSDSMATAVEYIRSTGK